MSLGARLVWINGRNGPYLLVHSLIHRECLGILCIAGSVINVDDVVVGVRVVIVMRLVSEENRGVLHRR